MDKRRSMLMWGLLLAACAADDESGETPKISTTTPFSGDTSDGGNVDAGPPAGVDDDDDGDADIEPTAGCLAVCEQWITCYDEPVSEVDGCAEDCTWELEELDETCVGLTESLNACLAALTCEDLLAWDEVTTATYPCQSETDAWVESCNDEAGEGDTGSGSGGDSGESDSGTDTGAGTDSGGGTDTGAAAAASADGSHLVDAGRGLGRRFLATVDDRSRRVLHPLDTAADRVALGVLGSAGAQA
jgi:hypothetical protein